MLHLVYGEPLTIISTNIKTYVIQNMEMYDTVELREEY